MPTDTKRKDDAPACSGELLKSMVEVANQLSLLISDIELLRNRLERGEELAAVRINLMAAELNTAVLIERLIQMLIIATVEGIK